MRGVRPPVVEEAAPGTPVVEEAGPGTPVVEEAAPGTPVVEEAAQRPYRDPCAHQSVGTLGDGHRVSIRASGATRPAERVRLRRYGS